MKDPELVADHNIMRLVARFLKSGIMEAGIVYDTPEGTPQGGPVSPVLGNIYLHYVMDLWFEKQIIKNCKGLAYMVRYADDSVFCFEKIEDAREFYAQMIERLRKFSNCCYDKHRDNQFVYDVSTETTQEGLKVNELSESKIKKRKWQTYRKVRAQSHRV